MVRGLHPLLAVQVVAHPRLIHAEDSAPPALAFSTRQSSHPLSTASRTAASLWSMVNLYSWRTATMVAANQQRFALRQPLGRVVVSLLVPVQRRGGERQIVQVGREAPAHGGAGGAQPGVVRLRYGDHVLDVGLAEALERGAIVGGEHAAESVSDPRLDALRVPVVVSIVA